MTTAEARENESSIALRAARVPSPPIPLFTLRDAPHGNATQNSGPSGSLILTRKASSSSAFYRFIPAHGLAPTVDQRLFTAHWKSRLGHLCPSALVSNPISRG